MHTKAPSSHLRDVKRLDAADRHLSAAQGELGALINAESHIKAPELYAAANGAWDTLEKMRRTLSSKRMTTLALMSARK
jgi:hypothetical protein